ncbi:MAG: Hsp70 family protein, partial [Polyangiaceae bacterium]
ATDSQPSVEVHVMQGERTEARYNRTLGKFHLEGIMPAPRGVPKVEVAFDIDANGILSVHAKDTATGKDQKITITANSGITEAEIQNMVKEAAEHETEDKERREQIERRNKLDNLCYTLEKTMGENKDKLAAADLSSVEALIKEGREAVEKQDDDKIKDVSERLEKEAHRIGTTMYQAAAAGGGGGGEGAEHADDDANGAAPPADGKAPGKKEGGVIDAEFEETP